MDQGLINIVSKKENTAVAHNTTTEKQAEDDREEFQGNDVIRGPRWWPGPIAPVILENSAKTWRARGIFVGFKSSEICQTFSKKKDLPLTPSK